MTKDKFYKMASEAYKIGKLVNSAVAPLPFDAGETRMEEYELAGYRFEYHDGRFNSATRISDGCVIDLKKLNNIVDLSTLTFDDLQELVSQGQVELEERRAEGFKLALRELDEMWQSFKKRFPDTMIRVIVNPDTEGYSYDYPIEDLDFELSRFKRPLA